LVTLRNEGSGKIQEFQIVGVDEADISKGKISFISPLSRVLINKKAGDRVILKHDRHDTIVNIMSVDYR